MYVGTLAVGPSFVTVIEAAPGDEAGEWLVLLSGFFDGTAWTMEVDVECPLDELPALGVRAALEAATQKGHEGAVTLVHEGRATPETIVEVIAAHNATVLQSMSVEGAPCH